MTYNEACNATLDELTDELAAAGWDSTQQTHREAFEAVVALLAETSPAGLPQAYHDGCAAAKKDGTCPFETGSDEWDLWHLGFESAQ